jgi:CHAT domain-containing protein
VETFTVRNSPAEIDNVARRFHRRVELGAAVEDLRDELRFFGSFVQPALPFLTTGTTLVVIPDGALSAIPMAVVPDGSGAPIVLRHPVAFASSLTAFVRQTNQLALFAPDSVLAIGDGHDPQATGLPALRRADAEAQAIGALYRHATVLVGPAATARTFLAADEAVIHFAGHTITDPEFPFLSRALFAEDPRPDTSSILFGSDVVAHHFSRTAVLVLASCEAALGRPARGDSANSLAQMFATSGISDVVASIWTVDDDDPLMLEFHRQLRATGDAAAALRAAQLTLAGQSIQKMPLKRWAGFVVLGGINPRQVS